MAELYQQQNDKSLENLSGKLDASIKYINDLATKMEANMHEKFEELTRSNQDMMNEFTLLDQKQQEDRACLRA